MFRLAVKRFQPTVRAVVKREEKNGRNQWCKQRSNVGSNTPLYQLLYSFSSYHSFYYAATLRPGKAIDYDLSTFALSAVSPDHLLRYKMICIAPITAASIGRCN